jgi:allophanate hydrolase subunit 1
MYQPVGDQAVLVCFEERIDPGINERVCLLSELIKQQGFPWLEETVFSYRSVLVIYRPRMIHFPEVKMPGESIRFQAVNLPRAYEALEQREQLFLWLQDNLSVS